MLIECPECKKQISSSARNCPNCGFKPNTVMTSLYSYYAKDLKIILIIFIIILFISSFAYRLVYSYRYTEEYRTIQFMLKNDGIIATPEEVDEIYKKIILNNNHSKHKN